LAELEDDAECHSWTRFAIGCDRWRGPARETAILGGKALMPYLCGVGVGDSRVYASVGVLLALSTLAATWIPARRATRVRLVETLASD
jgi:hypothetical protein